MGWKRSEKNLALFLLFIVLLRPLGHCAALRGEGKTDKLNVFKAHKQGHVLVGQAGSEEPESKGPPGKLLIGLNGSAPVDFNKLAESLKPAAGSLHDSDYQSDQADWSELQHLQGSAFGFGGSYSPAVQKLLGMRPKVDCDEEAMMLRVHGGPGAFGYGLLIDRGSFPPLPLARMPSKCGLHIQRTWWGLVIVVPYDGCYVAQEMDSYVLPLRLWGLPAKMSCPLVNLAPSPPSVSCYPNGMIVKTQNVAPVEDLWVKVENEWQPVLKASPKCGYSIVSHSDGVVVSAPYKPCMEVKDEVYSLHMTVRNELFRLFCPSLVPSLPLNLSSPVTPDQSDRVDTSTLTKLTPVDGRPIPSQRPTTWPWLGHPHPYHPQLPLEPVPTRQQPYTTSPKDPQPTSVPTSSATPQEVHQIPYPQFPDTWYPAKPPTSAPSSELPAPSAFTQVPVTLTSTTAPSHLSSELFGGLDQSPPKIPEQPTQPPPGSVPSVPPGHDPGFPFLYSESSSPVESPGSHPQRPWWPYPPQYPKRPSVTPPAESFVPNVTVPQTHPGHVFDQWHFLPQPSQRPAVSPTAAPPESFEAFGVLGATGSREGTPQTRPESAFAQGARLPYLPQRPQHHVFPTYASPESFEALRVLTGSHQATPQMRPESSFAQGAQLYYPPQYPQRPAIFPTAAPFETSSVLGEAGSSYQAVSHMSKLHGYLQCCPSPALYSNCCPPSLSYHQHTHRHFGLPNPGAATRSTSNLTSLLPVAHSGSATQLVATQAKGNYAQHTVALPLQEEIQQASTKPPESLSRKPTVAPMTDPNLFISSIKRPWTGQMPPLLYPTYVRPNVSPLAFLGSRHSHPSRASTASPLQSARPAHEEGQQPSVPPSRQTHPALSQLNFRNPFSTHLYDKAPMYRSQASIPSTVALPHSFATMPEPQKQDPVYPKLSKHTSGAELPIQLNALSQEQVSSGPGGLEGVLSLDHVTEGLSIPHFQVVTGPFSKHWVPVVPPEQAKQAFSDLFGRRPPPNYSPHGPL